MGKIYACLALIAVALCGCATMPPAPAPGCSIDAYPLTRAAADIRGARFHALGLSEGKRVSSLGDLLSDRLNPLALDATHPVTHALLLSGGSQHGAFGGGFLAGLKQSNSLIDYDVVTGISTGAIQSPFAFLANDPEPDDRAYPPFMENSKGFGTIRSTNMTDLAIAYLIDRESDLIHERSLGYASLALSGSLETFAPMRKLALGLISQKTLEAIRKHSGNRLLLVGVTSLKDATTYALDLTALADDAEHNPADRECFVDAILASAAVPPGISPVTLTTHFVLSDKSRTKNEPGSFIDGGSRYAVFFDQLQFIRQADAGKPVNIDVIVNGLLHLDDWIDPITKKAVSKYSVVDVMMRASDILESQARETSVESAEQASNGGKFRIAYMPGPDSDSHLYPPPGDPRSTACWSWEVYDKRRFHPLEFYPNYMRCILDYGFQRGKNGRWSYTK